MLTKDQIVEEIKKIISSGKDIEDELSSFLKKDLEQAITKLEDAKSSIKSLTLETLDDIKVGAVISEQKIGHALTEFAGSILETTRAIASDALEGAQILADRTRKKFDAAIEAAGDIDKVEDQVKAEMEKAYQDFVEKIDMEKTRLSQVEGAIKEFAEKNARKLNKDVIAELEKSAEKARTDIEEFEIKARELLEKLLHHSDEKVNRWLKNLKNKS